MASSWLTKRRESISGMTQEALAAAVGSDKCTILHPFAGGHRRCPKTTKASARMARS